jgi:hypothetical protein
MTENKIVMHINGKPIRRVWSGPGVPSKEEQACIQAEIELEQKMIDQAK